MRVALWSLCQTETENLQITWNRKREKKKISERRRALIKNWKGIEEECIINSHNGGKRRKNEKSYIEATIFKLISDINIDVDFILRAEFVVSITDIFCEFLLWRQPCRFTPKHSQMSFFRSLCCTTEFRDATVLTRLEAWNAFCV